MKTYSAGFTGAGIFRQEIREVLRLQIEGQSSKEISSFIVENNIFQMSNEPGIKERLQKVTQRIKTFDVYLKQTYLNGTRYEENALILYGYLVTYRFPYEFFIEVILYNYLQNRKIILTSDLDHFLERKESGAEEVKSWTVQTRKRIRQSIFMFFRECGLLMERNTDEYEITPLYINSELKQYAEEKYPLLDKLTTLR
jgi:hypothetical protein